ncbi:MAG: PIG-L family deacetylase [Chloroflexi bacterium]|nr:PIG-L family deacetylase [Chloroflexota bacterium]
MDSALKLLAVFAHPDDESLGIGSTLAKYAAEGVETHLACATRGERGWQGPPETFPGLEALGKIREGELLAAAEILGVRQVEFLDYIDGELDDADPAEATARIVRVVRRIRPQVVITFEPFGAYGHPDHIAISQLTTAALLRSADPNYPLADGLPAHCVSKLYYATVSEALYRAWLDNFGDIQMAIDGKSRRAVAWVDWAQSAIIDGKAHWAAAWQAILQHKSQIGMLGDVSRLSENEHFKLWGELSYYRAYSLVNGGRQIEDDLFAGLR